MRFFYLLAIFLSACSGDLPASKEVLSPDKLGVVLYDVVRADEMVDLLKMSDSTFRNFSKRTALYDSVLTLHGLTKTAFKKSLDYYESRPDLLKEILDDLQRKIADTASKKKEPKRIKLSKPNSAIKE